MKLLKVLVGLVIAVIALFLFAAKFSSVEARYECSGVITSGDTEIPAKVFLKLETYRSWVGLWSDSSGSAWVELPNKTVDYFGRITEAGDLLQLWDFSDSLKGSFSTLSGALMVDVGAFGMFEGSCQVIGTQA
jgi:hypothetical protein